LIPSFNCGYVLTIMCIELPPFLTLLHRHQAADPFQCVAQHSQMRTHINTATNISDSGPSNCITQHSKPHTYSPLQQRYNIISFNWVETCTKPTPSTPSSFSEGTTRLTQYYSINRLRYSSEALEGLAPRSDWLSFVIWLCL
jgi:hypothetical protein